MARSRNRWSDDDDETNEPTRSNVSRGGTSPLMIVLLSVGGVFLLIGLACGGIMFVGYRKAQQAEQEAFVDARRAELEARRAELEREAAEIEHANRGAVVGPIGELQRDDAPPPPMPGSAAVAEPPPQPIAKTFPNDDGDNAKRWRVLFRSKSPALWNTNTQAGDDFAIPLQSTLAETKYLRLRRLDTGDTIIIAMTRGRIGRADPADRKVRWNGGGNDEHGGYHLGIAEGPVARFTEGKGTIGVLMDGWDANPGSGFGHAHHVDNGGQRFSWLGKEIDATVFEIAVTTTELTVAEKKLLR